MCHHTPLAASDGNANVDGNKSIGALNDERKYKLGVCYILKMKQIKGSRQEFQKFDKRPLLILFCWRGVDGGREWINIIPRIQRYYSQSECLLCPDVPTHRRVARVSFISSPILYPDSFLVFRGGAIPELLTLYFWLASRCHIASTGDEGSRKQSCDVPQKYGRWQWRRWDDEGPLSSISLSLSLATSGSFLLWQRRHIQQTND